jgi:predicted phosphodiesterase
VTRIAAIADIHSNAPALGRALHQIGELDVDLALVAGDAIDSTLPPGTEETIEQLREVQAIAIRGNHERWALEHPGIVTTEGCHWAWNATDDRAAVVGGGDRGGPHLEAG